MEDVLPAVRDSRSGSKSDPQADASLYDREHGLVTDARAPSPVVSVVDACGVRGARSSSPMRTLLRRRRVARGPCRVRVRGRLGRVDAVSVLLDPRTLKPFPSKARKSCSPSKASRRPGATPHMECRMCGRNIGKRERWTWIRVDDEPRRRAHARGWGCQRGRKLG